MMDLADKLNTSVDKSNNLEVENKTLKQVLGKKSTLKTKLKFVRNEVCVLKKQNKFLSSKIKTKDGLIKRLRGQVAYTTCTSQKSQKYPRQISDLSTENRNLILRIRDLENSILNVRQKLNDEMEENDYLRLLINDNEQKKLHIFDEERHCYSKELQECVYELLNHNITTSHVGPVINSVLNMTGVKANKLPSTSTINNMNDFL